METDGTTIRKVLDDVDSHELFVGGRLFFSHRDRETGNELWVLE